LAGARLAGFGVLLGFGGVEEKENARAFAVERIGLGAVVFVNWPHIKIAFENAVARLAEEGPNPLRLFSLAMGEHDEWPGRAGLDVLFLAIDGSRVAEWPEVGGRIA